MKNIKYFVGAVCLALSLNSCSDFLNEEPVSEIPAGDMWQTARDAKAGINEIYGLLRSTLRENYFYWGEFRSDNVAPGAPVMADQARVINNLMSTDEKCAKWTTLYQMINQTNLAIKYVPNISMPDVADRNDYLGQAYALRALAYFYAIRAGLNTLTENDFASEDEVVNYILRERQVELAGEGRRWFDLLRTGKWKEVMKPINGMEQDGNELFPIHYSHITVTIRADFIHVEMNKEY
jgi:hypothetical protein